MYCPRLDHFVRLNSNGTIGKCGHMTIQHGFDSVDSMHSSDWLAQVKAQFAQDEWPEECSRCQDTEQIKNTSVRTASIKRDQLLKRFDPDYLIVGGVLDNVCNSACQSCSSDLSTKIGALTGDPIKVRNRELLDTVPWERIVELDINGGEPTASPRYKQLLETPPPNVKIIRVNTNCSRVLPNIENLLKKQIKIIITASLDGTGLIHDYVRWPIKWSNYTQTIERYCELRSQYRNLELQAWTTLHSQNALDFANIVQYCQQHEINHDWALLEYPVVLDARYSNRLSRAASGLLETDYPEIASQIAVRETNDEFFEAFVKAQDRIRSINIKDYYEDCYYR